MRQRSEIVKTVFYSLICLAALAYIPRGLSYGRTIATIFNLQIQDRNIYYIIASIFTLILTTVCIKAMVRTVGALCVRKSVNTADLWILSVCIMFYMLMLWSANKVFQRYSEIYKDSINIGTEIISEIDNNPDIPDIKIYIDDIPELYRRQGVRVSNQMFVRGGYSDKDPILYITRKDKELYHLIEQGWLFGELSEQEGIYTNDEKVAEIIEKHGIGLKNCYSVKKKVDLEKIAEANGLTVLDNGGLLVQGQEKSLIHGPWDAVHRGFLCVEYKIKLLSTSIAEGEIGTVRVSGEAGKNVVWNHSVNKGDFDKTGYLKIEYVMKIQDIDGLELLFIANGDTEVEILEISYGKVESEKERLSE